MAKQKECENVYRWIRWVDRNLGMRQGRPPAGPVFRTYWAVSCMGVGKMCKAYNAYKKVNKGHAFYRPAIVLFYVCHRRATLQKLYFTILTFFLKVKNMKG